MNDKVFVVVVTQFGGTIAGSIEGVYVFAAQEQAKDFARRTVTNTLTAARIFPCEIGKELQ